MTTRRELLTAAPVAGAFVAFGPTAFTARSIALAQEGTAPGPLWRSPSLVEKTVTGPNGEITTRDMIEANARLAMTEKRAIEIAPDVWLLAGWGIAHSMAIRAPEGWIIVDTGDSTRAAKEMREKLEWAVGGPIRVAAILLTHWHYSNGTAAWSDEGAELWGHEWLDRNRAAGTGVGPLAGFYQARAISQFAVFHPTKGADAFPNNLRFSPEKLLAESSYRPPVRLFTNGMVEPFTIAGEKVEVMPNRSDSSDSVGFYFPSKRLLISNFMAPSFIFNIFSLRGGPFRNPEAYIEDNRRMESYDAATLLDLHAAPVTGQEAVRDAIRRSGDQVRLIRDQSLRMIARGMDGRAAAEAVFMPPSLREGWEFYGQDESHVRQIYSGTVGWFGSDVCDINPLPIAEETRRTIALMGGPVAVRTAAADAAAAGDIAGWQWALRLTSLLLQRDAQDAEARKVSAASCPRARPAHQILECSWLVYHRGAGDRGPASRDGQASHYRRGPGRPRNAPSGRIGCRGYGGQPCFPAGVDRPGESRRPASRLHPSSQRRQTGVADRNAQRRDPNEPTVAPLPDHVTLSRSDLAGFVLGLSSPASGTPLAALDAGLDRSGFVFLPPRRPPDWTVLSSRRTS